MFAIAIDGPAGAGKSSAAKLAAKKLGFIYVDTGALYRTVGLYMLEHEISPKDIKAVEDALKEITVELKFLPDGQHVFLGTEDVSDKIRTPQVSMAASSFSSIAQVRSFLFDLQVSMAEKYNVLMDGRDIGTVVLPHAQVKIFLTASAEERARRRCLELEEKGEKVSYEEVLADIQQRDYQDSHREIAPLVPAKDAEIVDTSDCGLEEAVERILQIVYKKLPKSPVDFSESSGI